MTAYYNEIDPFAAAWLRELIKGGHVAPGDVDERSIADVSPDDLRAYTQCHFFAGIGVWSYALRKAGWPDNQPVWTGSCPCQPFSTAGKKGGFSDERHLWPVWHRLIEKCRPDVVLGEQVASKDGLEWLDLVSSDLEGAGYAFGASDLCAAGVGPLFGETELGRSLIREVGERESAETDPRRKAVWREFADYLGGLVAGQPHIRQRLFFVGLADDDDDAGLERRREPRCERTCERAAGASGVAGGLADTSDQRRLGRGSGETGAEPGSVERSERLCASGGVADSERGAAERHGHEVARTSRSLQGEAREQRLRPDAGDGRSRYDPDPLHGDWRDPDWLFCRDGKFRPVESGTFPLVDGATARVGRLRGYGNAINAKVAEAFIRSVIEAKADLDDMESLLT